MHSTFSGGSFLCALCSVFVQVLSCSQKPEEKVLAVVSGNGAASFAFHGLICTTEARSRRGLLASNVTALPRGARQGSGRLLLSTSITEVSRSRELGWFLHLHAGHTPRDTRMLHGRAGGLQGPAGPGTHTL